MRFIGNSDVRMFWKVLTSLCLGLAISPITQSCSGPKPIVQSATHSQWVSYHWPKARIHFQYLNAYSVKINGEDSTELELHRSDHVGLEPWVRMNVENGSLEDLPSATRKFGPLSINFCTTEDEFGSHGAGGEFLQLFLSNGKRIIEVSTPCGSVELDSALLHTVESIGFD